MLHFLPFTLDDLVDCLVKYRMTSNRRRQQLLKEEDYRSFAGELINKFTNFYN